MLKDILQRLAEDTGYNLEEDRAALINLVHRSAEMLYRRLECNAIMREVTLLVPSNKIIALPSFIGPLRGMREAQTDINFTHNTQIFPRFVKNDWQYKFMNWRELQTSPIMRDLDTIAPLTIIVSEVEDTPAVVKIVGQTNTAARIEEEVTLDATTNITTNSFGPAIFSIVSFSTRTHDITIKDDDANIIAVLSNNEQKTSYRLVDVSEYAWAKDVTDGTTTIEVLYKHPYYKMVNDADEFPATGYEDGIYFGAMALWAAPQQGKESIAQSFMQQSLIEPFSAKADQEQNQVKKLRFGRNPIYGAIRRRYSGIPIINSDRTL